MSNYKRLLSILFPLVIFFLILFIFGKSDNPFASMVITIVAGFLALIVASLLLRAIFFKNYFLILLGTFVIKTSIGISHYLIYIQPSYFSGGPLDFLSDYTQMHTMMSIAADSRIHNGFFSLVNSQLFLINKDYLFYYVLSTLYYFTGSHALNICVFNAFISSLTAVIVLHLYSLIDKTVLKGGFVLWLACLFPMNLIASALMRDIAGQFFIAMGLLILSLDYKNYTTRLISIAVSMLLMSLQRAIYLLFPIITYVFIKVKKNKPVLLLSSIVLIFLILNFLSRVPFFERFYGYAFNAQFNISRINTFLLLPFRLIRALIGPIPWTNILSNSMQTTYLSTNYLQSVVDITLLWILVPEYFTKREKIGIIEIIVLLFIFTGISTPDVHTYYFATAFIFLIPFVGDKKKIFFSTFWRIIIFYIIFNFLYVSLGFAGTGIFQNTA